MGRWQPDARTRLEQAGLALFEERGYEATTVADIAAAAGLTERTFFRHFADKREVLFSGSVVLADLMAQAVAAAPAGASPAEAVRAALTASASFFDERRSHAVRRQRVVTGNPVLLERELMKMATLTGTLVDALRARGDDGTGATLAAEVGVLVFRVGFTRWLVEDRPLAAVFDETYEQVGAASAGPQTAASGSAVQREV